MVEINRVWLNVDTDTNKITLFGRPRVSIHVDEYIWSLIEEHIVKPHKLMRSEKHKYLLKIAFGRFDPVRHQYYPLSPYNGPLLEGVKPDSANGWYPRENFADTDVYKRQHIHPARKSSTFPGNRDYPLSSM